MNLASTRGTQPSLAPALTRISALSARISAHISLHLATLKVLQRGLSCLTLTARRISPHTNHYEALVSPLSAAILSHISTRAHSAPKRVITVSGQPPRVTVEGGRRGRCDTLNTRQRSRHISPRTDPCPSASQPQLKRCAFFLSQAGGLAVRVGQHDEG